MTLPVPNQSYNVTTGSSSSSVFITLLAQRNPTSNDVNFQVTKRWVNTITAKEFILTGFTSTGGVTQAVWVNLTNGTASGLDELTGNTGLAVQPDGGGNINVLGDGNTIRIDGTPVDNKLTAFLVQPAQYTIFAGGTTAITGISPSTAGYVLTSNGVAADASFQPATSGGINWSLENAGNFTSAVGAGYIVGTLAAVTTLPSGAVFGETICYICKLASILTITAPAGVTISVGTQVSSVAGTAVNLDVGASIVLVYGNVNQWWSLGAPQGNFNLT